MVDFASLPIPVVPYTPTCRPGVGLAMAPLSEVRRKLPVNFVSAPHRLAFHQLVLVEAGVGDFTVDSTRYACRTGSLLWIRPNQVIQFASPTQMEARLVMFTETFPLRLRAHMGMLDDVLRPSHWQLSDDELAGFGRVVALMQEEFERPDQGLGEDILKHLLAVALMHIDQMCRSHRKDIQRADSPSGENGELFLRFRRELETSYRTTRLVEHYAAALNCTPRTLSRACRVIAGTSTKDLIDARVALEAKRLLVHTDLPVGTIARQLGFTEVTNFGKFFVRRVNMTPGTFRRADDSQN
ncbi:transcriptional regulator, AraC family [Streptomyces turgidiscabies Car8]|uniref:Transcriptional regulator, AraC family n=1 Tax=Streptomyces turgidiscabies (strain Car8) TaxID=698760 RepID=L7FAW6_STRT8|nr:transcriptional regulator, AraC family [Streptomyces turgidiscabies Car8]GAQ76522.1 HTH-type transcriptional activator RhaS [Streptomyces turgidiscabies]